MGNLISKDQSQALCGMMMIDAHGKITWVNSAATHLTGLAVETILGQPLGFLYRNSQNDPGFDLMWQAVFRGETWRDQFVYLPLEGPSQEHDLQISPVINPNGEILHFFAVVCAVRDSESLAERTRQTDELYQASLSKLDQAINQSMDPDVIFDQINEFAVQVLQMNVGAVVMLPDPEKGTFSYWRSNIQLDSNEISPENEPEHASVINWIAQNKRALIISDTSQSPYQNNRFIQDFGVQSGIGMPVFIDDVVGGILFFLDNSPRHFEEFEIEYATALANRAALAIAKAELFRSLRSAKSAAEEAAKDRADYLASMSHELRTPLAAINNLSELISGTPLSAVQAEYLALIKSSADRLLALMNDILDYSRLEASKLGLVEKQFSLIQVVENALDLAAIPAAQKGLDLAYRIDEDVPEILVGDSNRLSQVLTNLLTNAIKFTSSGHIYIEIRQRAEKIAFISMVDSIAELQISVQDTGIGIAADKQVNLFKPFSQVGDPQKLPEPGSGLGLAICKRLVQLMGGNIWVTSKGVPGQGSTFTFTMHARVVHTPVAPFMQMEQPSLQGKHVLLIGKPVASWALMSNRLEHWGLSVWKCEDGQTAVERLESEPAVDFVLLDAQAINPAVDERLADSIERLRIKYMIPIIAYVQPNTRLRQTLRTVATHILRRPISLQRLYRVLVEESQVAEAVTRPRTLEPDLGILLVDDDLINLAAVQLQLERLGITADTVSSGVEALQVLDHREYDLVIMDMRMDAMDGHATTRAIRQNLAADRQPLIAILTAGVTANQLNALQNAGIDAYLEKPVTIERLLHLIELAHHIHETGSKGVPPEIHIPDSQPALADTSSINMKILDDLVGLAASTDKQPSWDIFNQFFDSVPRLLEQVRQAVDSKQLEALKGHLHALRGTCEIFGAVRLSRMCKDLEKELADGAPDDLVEQIAAIENESNVVVETLQRYRSETTS